MDHISLSYYTAGMTVPSGKPYIFFAATPEDFQNYFKTIANQIIQIRDSAIWYFPEDTNFQILVQLNEEDISALIDEMQLIVIPVTSNILLKSNFVLDIIFPFAQKRHIPILPIMEESGLEKEFEKVFGSIQFLTPNNEGDGIPFSKKLEKFLFQVIVGEETAKKVRDAFDAYIFISYRKKDRKYANELIKLIHANPQCEDIAIWYDEYLIPGENYNQAIEDVLSKSDLFSLVVTPNLLENGNYVEQNEYPDAKRLGKPIVPVEMVPTDRALLENSFNDIPNLVQPYQGAISQEIINNLVIPENNDDPIHEFFVGLAYLDGIDVEVDLERALRLITFAANSGLLEAIKKLVDMYYTGNGVDVNICSAIEWQNKVIDSLKQNWTDDKTEENFYDYYAELKKQAEYYSIAGDEASSLNIFLNMEKIIDESEIKNEEKLKRVLAETDYQIGIAYKSNHVIKRAEEYLRKAYQEFSNIQGEYFDDDFRKLILLQEQLASIKLEAESSKNALMGSLNTFLSIFGEEEDDSEPQEMIKGQENIEIGIKILQECLEKYNHRSKKKKTTEAIIDIIRIQGKLGDAYVEKGDLDKAIEYYQQQLTKILSLDTLLVTPENRRWLANCYLNLAGVEEKRSLQEEERKYFQKAIAQFRKNLEGSKLFSDYWGLGMALSGLGLSYDSKEPEHEKYLHEAEAQMNEALQRFPNIDDSYKIMYRELKDLNVASVTPVESLDIDELMADMGSIIMILEQQMGNVKGNKVEEVIFSHDQESLKKQILSTYGEGGDKDVKSFLFQFNILCEKFNGGRYYEMGEFLREDTVGFDNYCIENNMLHSEAAKDLLKQLLDADLPHLSEQSSIDSQIDVCKMWIHSLEQNERHLKEDLEGL